MKGKKILKKACAGVLSASMVVGMSLATATSVFAEGTTTYSAPTAAMEVDKKIITGSAHRAASPSLEILGVNSIAGFGMIEGGSPSDLASAQECAALGVWGTNLNENPDPYYYNNFYNYYADANNLEKTKDALININLQGSPNQADTITYQYSPDTNVTVSTYYQPDILVGVQAKGADTYDKSGYNDQINYIKEKYNSNYNPQLVSYNPANLDTMVQTMKELATAIKEVETQTGKTTRYGDPMVIVENYEQYINGIKNYINSNIKEKKTIAIINGANDDGTYNAITSYKQIYYGASSDRFVEYTVDVTNNIADQYDSEKTGGATLSADQLKDVDAVLVERAGKPVADKLTEYFNELGEDKLIIYTEPSTLYGLTMNAVENAMGLAYYEACLYQDVIDIDPVEVCAYFYKTFFHITDENSLQTVVSTNFADVAGIGDVILSNDWETRMNRIVATTTSGSNSKDDDSETNNPSDPTNPDTDNSGTNTENPSDSETVDNNGNTNGNGETSSNGSTNTDGKESNAVQTGDMANIGLYISILAAASFTGTYTYRRKRG